MWRLHRRIKNLESAGDRPAGREEITRGIAHRIEMAILDELARLRAPRHIPGQKDPKDRIGPSLMKERYGPAWTYGQWLELAIRRVFFERLEECLSPGWVGTEDYLPCLDEEDLTQEGRERMATEWIESRREAHGGSWDEVNKWTRQEREKAVREEWEV
jgi:hypothetical protein